MTLASTNDMMQGGPHGCLSVGPMRQLPDDQQWMYLVQAVQHMGFHSPAWVVLIQGQHGLVGDVLELCSPAHATREEPSPMDTKEELHNQQAHEGSHLQAHSGMMQTCKLLYIYISCSEAYSIPFHNPGSSIGIVPPHRCVQGSKMTGKRLIGVLNHAHHAKGLMPIGNGRLATDEAGMWL